jgi:hypothetical protein
VYAIAPHTFIDKNNCGPFQSTVLPTTWMDSGKLLKIAVRVSSIPAFPEYKSHNVYKSNAQLTYWHTKTTDSQA